MNKYIVATEDGKETVNAEEVEIAPDGALVFYILEKKILAASFKEYKHFLTTHFDLNEGETLNDLKVGDKISVEGLTVVHSVEPWSAPLNDSFPPIVKIYSYVRVFDHLSNGKPVELILENEQGVKNIGYCYYIHKGANIDPFTGDCLKVSVKDEYNHPLTWVYYDKGGNLESAIIRTALPTE